MARIIDSSDFSAGDDLINRSLSDRFFFDQNFTVLRVRQTPIDLGDGENLIIGRLEGAAFSIENNFNGIDINGEMTGGDNSDILLGGMLMQFDGIGDIDGIDFDAPASFGQGDDGVLGYAIALGVDFEVGGGSVSLTGVDTDEGFKMGAGNDVLAGAGLLVSGPDTILGGDVTGVSTEELSMAAGNDLVFGIAASLVFNPIFAEPNNNLVAVLEEPVFELNPSVQQIGVEILGDAILAAGDDTMIGISVGLYSGGGAINSSGIYAADGSYIEAGDGDDVIFGHSAITIQAQDTFISASADGPDGPYLLNGSIGANMAGSFIDMGADDDKLIGIGTTDISGEGQFAFRGLGTMGLNLIEADVLMGSGDDVVLGVAAGDAFKTGINLGSFKNVELEEVREAPLEEIDFGGEIKTGTGDDIVIGLSLGKGVGISGGTISLGNGNDILVAASTSGPGMEGTTVNGRGGDDVFYVSGGYGTINGGDDFDTLILTYDESDLHISESEGVTYITGSGIDLVVEGVENIVFGAPEIDEILATPGVEELVFGDPIGLGDISLEGTGVESVVDPLEEQFGDLGFDPLDFSIAGLLETVYGGGA